MAPGGNKKSRKKSKKNGHFVQQKKRVFRASSPVLSVFMWGVNHVIEGLNHVNIPPILLPDDFRAFTKIKIENHMYNKDVFPSKFKFKSYWPLVFHDLRKRFGIDDTVFMNSLTQHEARKADSGEGIYISHDSRFVLKSITTEVVALFHQIIVQYHQHVVEKEGNTLLPQYLGMYRVNVGTTQTYLLVVRNVFSSTLPIHVKYDLKGAAGRSASSKQKSKELPTLKDQDLTAEGRKLNVGTENRDAVLKMLQADTRFLAELKMQGYSMLVGIHDAERHARDMAKHRRHSDVEEEDAVSAEESCDEEFSASEDNREGACGDFLTVRGTSFNLGRSLQAPNALVIGSAKDVSPSILSGYYPVVSRDVDYYAFAASQFTPNAASGSTIIEEGATENSEVCPSPANGSKLAEDGGKGASQGSVEVMPADDDATAFCTEIFFIGIIDVLNPYHCGPRKVAAHTAQSFTHIADADGAPANPKTHAQRLVDFFSANST